MTLLLPLWTMLLLLFFHGKSRNSPEWFADNETEKRNSAILDKMNRVTRRATKNLRNNCKQLKSAILWAKNNWINRVCDNVNRSDNTRISTRTYWDSIKLLKRGMTNPLLQSEQWCWKKTAKSVQVLRRMLKCSVPIFETIWQTNYFRLVSATQLLISFISKRSLYNAI